jgi:hypothetical protein
VRNILLLAAGSAMYVTINAGELMNQLMMCLNQYSLLFITKHCYIPVLKQLGLFYTTTTTEITSI